MRMRTRTRSQDRSNSPTPSSGKTRSIKIHSAGAPRARSFDEKRDTGMAPLHSGNGFANGGRSSSRSTSKHRGVSQGISALEHRGSDGGGVDDDDDDVDDDDDDENRNGMSAHLDRLASCVAYSFCSISMVLANKAIASYNEKEPASAAAASSGALQKESADLAIHVLPVAFQNLCCVALLEILRALRVVQYERPFRSNGRMLLVLPLSTSFVAMITSGYMCLHHLNVPMVTVFKNVTNLLIVGGEWFCYGEPLTPGIVMSVSIMFFGAVFAALNDLTFTTTGLGWVVINCTTSAAYALYMRRLTSVMSRSPSNPKMLHSAGHLLRRRKTDGKGSGRFKLTNGVKGDLESSDESVGSIHSGDDLDLEDDTSSPSSSNGSSSYHQHDPQQQQQQSDPSKPESASAVFDLSRLATVLLNNSISLVLLLTVATVTGELSDALAHLGLPTRLDQAIPSGTTVVFKSASVLSGGSIASASSGSPVHGFDVAYAALNAFTGSVGFFLNFAQLWCVGATSATTYAIIGSLNKIPITIFGHFIFKTAITRQGQLFVCLNLVGCLSYSYCKIMLKRRKNGVPSDFKAQINSFPSSAGLLRSFPSSIGVILHDKKTPR